LCAVQTVVASCVLTLQITRRNARRRCVPFWHGTLLPLTRSSKRMPTTTTTTRRKQWGANVSCPTRLGASVEKVSARKSTANALMQVSSAGTTYVCFICYYLLLVGLSHSSFFVYCSATCRCTGCQNMPPGGFGPDPRYGYPMPPQPYPPPMMPVRNSYVVEDHTSVAAQSLVSLLLFTDHLIPMCHLCSRLYTLILYRRF